MKLFCPVCEISISTSKHIWSHVKSDLLQCSNCGLVYHLVSGFNYKTNVENHYSSQSWGSDGESTHSKLLLNKDVQKHFARMDYNLEFCLSNTDLQKRESLSILDIGCGIGLMEVLLEQKRDLLPELSVVMLEPAQEIYQLIRQRFRNNIVVNGHINQIIQSRPAYDLILCMGVDYLFEDIQGAFRLIHSLLKPDGFLLVSRNVFIDMNCYFGGLRIDSSEDLFSPNPLINAYFIEEHYAAFLSKNFQIKEKVIYEEKYENQSEMSGKHLNYILQKKSDHYDFSPLMTSQYKNRYDIELARLSQSSSQSANKQ